MKGVFLDKGSMDIGDIDFSPMKNLIKTWEEYDYSSPEETAKRVETADIVITNKVYIGEDILMRCKNLKLICVAATGTNNIDLMSARKYQIPVCNAAGYATHSVVQHVFSLILALHTHICEYRNLVLKGEWEKSKHFCLLNYPIIELAGKTLGIIGYGELGKAVAKTGEAFGLKTVVAESLSGNPAEGRIPMDELLQQSDIVSLHCPLTVQTINLIDEKSFKKMKANSILINTARGGIVNEAHLLEALRTRQIAGAGIDVLSKEPPQNSILIKENLPNLIVTPHIAWASAEARQRLVEEIGKNIDAFFAGEPRNIVS